MDSGQGTEEEFSRKGSDTMKKHRCLGIFSPTKLMVEYVFILSILCTNKVTQYS